MPQALTQCLRCRALPRLPDTTYAGGVTFTGTGLDFNSDPKVVKDAIALLKQRNPKTKVRWQAQAQAQAWSGSVLA